MTRLNGEKDSLIGPHHESPVGSLLEVSDLAADAELLDEHGTIAIQPNPEEFPRLQRSDNEISVPAAEQLRPRRDEARDAGGRHEREARFAELARWITLKGPCPQRILGAHRAPRPSVIRAVSDQIDLVSSPRSMLRRPNAPGRINRQALGVPMSTRVDPT